MDLKGKNILVTGGSGFIGSWTCELLYAEKPASITVIDNMIRGRPENLKSLLDTGILNLVRGDICNYSLLEKHVSEADIVIHLAALRITHCAAEPRLAFEVMARATFDLLELCVKYKVKRVIAASSASIYGLSDQFPTTENAHPYHNRTLYGALKCMNEGLLRSFNDMYGLNYAATRYFNVYGPRMDIHGKYTEVLIRWMERIDQGLPPVIFGDGMQTMDFIHVRDIARFNVLLAKSSCVDQVYNVARGEEISLTQLAQCLLHVMGRRDLKIDYQAERSINPVQRRLADVSKSHHDLDFLAEITLENGLSELVEWWRESRLISEVVQ